MATPRFVILEGHPLVREALVGRLVTRFGDTTIAYEGSSPDEAMKVLAVSDVSCIVLDLDVDRRRSPAVVVGDLAEAGAPILALVSPADGAAMRSALAAARVGLVSRQAEVDELLAAVETTLRGEHYVAKELVALLVPGSTTGVALSDQERRAMVLYASGLKMRAVARRMGVTEGTAQEYIKRVRAKYARAGTPLPTKTELYLMARREGYVP